MVATILGFLSGALAFVGLNVLLARHGARHRKRSGNQQPAADEDSGAGIAIGALVAGVPESMVLGLSFLTGGGLSVPILAAVFISPTSPRDSPARQ
ncbi:hypothetical protein [Tessaracoccus sp. ZS01]|uniref:hypothetical protein n=1 Tax=Tessaracoccus sp. ZS01 TaxID=1906324 RepID=UPI001E49380D|nr:hypothetical protein [Tessaracoccus sp. ZS01]